MFLVVTGAPNANNTHEHKEQDNMKPSGGIKVVQLAVLQKPTNNDHDDSDGEVLVVVISYLFYYCRQHYFANGRIEPQMKIWK